MKARSLFLLTIISFVWALSSPSSAAAQTPITFGAPSHDIDFPDYMTFEIAASSSAGQIVSAQLVYWVPSEVSLSTSLTREDLEFSPSSSVHLSFFMDTEGLTSFPSTPYQYYFIVEDSAGNTAHSPEYSIRYDDTRYDWDVFENDDVAVWTHNRPNSFGQSVFEIANRALAAQYPLFQVEITYQIRIIIYNNSVEFAEWHAVRTNAVGGEASPGIGVTTQIVSLGGLNQLWLNDVIPHEISHLYFAQAASNPKVAIPNWLNEGVATYNEFTDNSGRLLEVERLGQQGELTPLSSLDQGFGRLVDEDRFRIAYSESLSAVTYMVETYGEEGLANLLSIYKSGIGGDEAFLTAFGVDMTEFELGWAAWLGIPEGMYIIPTAWPMPTFRPSPTPYIIGAAPASTPAPSGPDAEPSPTPSSATDPEREDSDTVTGFFSAMLFVGGFTCLSFLLLIFVLWWLNRRRSKA